MRCVCAPFAFPYLPIDIYLVHKLTWLLITVMNAHIHSLGAVPLLFAFSHRRVIYKSKKHVTHWLRTTVIIAARSILSKM